MAFEAIRKILPASIQHAGISRQITAVRVVEETEAAIKRLWGEEKAAYARVVSFKDGVIKIMALAPVALQELKISTMMIQNEVNRVLGKKVVERIQGVL